MLQFKEAWKCFMWASIPGSRHLKRRVRCIFEKWSDFDRASSLICRNKMPTRYNRWFLLQILLLAQHVSGTIMPIIRSSRVLYRRYNLKTKGMYSLLLTHPPAHSFHIRSINTQPTNGILKPQTQTNQTPTRKKKLPKTPTHSPHDTRNAL